MPVEAVFQLALLLATFLCSLVAGFLFAFAVVAMPGISSLSDRGFIRAFQVIDGVIQNNQPLFILVWVGSIVVLVIAAIFGIFQLAGREQWLRILTTLLYLGGVQLPTIVINVPLNNKLQTLDVSTLDEQTLNNERLAFEPRWNRSNAFRTVMACLVSIGLILLLIII